MAGNTFGTIFKLTSFGESHGPSLGGIIDGLPSGIKLDVSKIQNALDRRKPGASFSGTDNPCVTERKEDDRIQILSGLFNGYTTGTSLAFEIKNTNQHSSDYSEMALKMRPGHADFTYLEKYGFRDYRGGGRSSGRETCVRVAAGEIAREVIESILGASYSCTAYTKSAAGITAESIDFSEIEKNPLRCPDKNAAKKMQEKIEQLRAEGNSAGGIIECVVNGLPSGLGEPVFDKLDALLAHAVLSVGAVKGIEFGSGFNAAFSTGKENNDPMHAENGKPFFDSNNAGGILGGISNGNTLIFRAAIKPVPSIFTEQKTVEAKMDADSPQKNLVYENSTLKIKGRHDVCLAPRIVPVIEAMTSLVIADLLLLEKVNKL